MLTYSVPTYHPHTFAIQAVSLATFTLSLHDALPTWPLTTSPRWTPMPTGERAPPSSCPVTATSTPSPRLACTPSTAPSTGPRSEEHTSELQSPCNVVCRLLFEKQQGN